MRRVLLLNTDLAVGGTPTVVRELATRLHAPQRGVTVDVACVGPWGPVADQIERAGLHVTALDADDAYDLPGVVKRFAALVRERQADTVFSFLIHANTVAATASRFLRDVRFVQSIQTTQARPRWHWWMQSVVHNAAESVVVPSPSVATMAEREVGVPREKIVVIPNAVDAEALAGVRQGPAGDRGKLRVVFLGRLDPIKRVPDLVEAMATLRERATLDVFGEGEQWDEIRRTIRRLGLDDRVRLHGPTTRETALARADVLALPSEAEGFGLVLIEAMAAGVPVVATDAPGIRDVVRHDQNGLLVPIGDPPACARAITRLADDAALRGRLVEQGLNDVRTRYAWERVLQQYRQVLKLPA